MNFAKYFKRNDYDNLDRLLVYQKIRNCRDPFEGDPFKIQSLNFHYADKPIFYPVTNHSKTIGNSKKPQTQNFLYNQPKYQNCFEKKNRLFDNSKSFPPLINPRRCSSSYFFSNVPKPNNNNSASITKPGSSKESLEDGGKRKYLNRSESLIHQTLLAPFTKEDAPPIHQTGLRKRLNNNLVTKKQTEIKPTFNEDHNGGCKITININGVPNNQVHINEQADHSISSQNSNNSKRKPSLYDIKPSKSYIIHRDDTGVNISVSKQKSSRKLLRECSTHSMIPHKEGKGTIKELRNSPSEASVATTSKLRLKTRSRDNTRLNLSKKSFCVENIACNNKFWQRTSSDINFKRQSSMLERILSSNPIVNSSRNNFNLTKSTSVLGQRFTPLPMSRKYTSEK